MNMIKANERTQNKRKNKTALQLCLSAIFPLAVFLLRPLNMTVHQSAVTAVLLLVIIWWCTDLVNKTLASGVLILFFLLFSGAPTRTVLSFPLSSTFLLIALTYLFSRGVTNSGLADQFFEPLLRKVGSTPVKTIMFGAAMLVTLIYAIPQPLARLIIVADIIKTYLDKTDADDGTKSVLLYSIFFLYIFINMMTMNADIILNTTAVTVAGLEMSDVQWIKYMAVPSLLYTAAALALFCWVFRKNIKGKRITMASKSEAVAESKPKGKITAVLCLVIVTMILWLTEPLHGIPNWTVTLVSVIVMYAMGELKVEDLRAIDVNMLIFLTAAMSIGGVMSANGTADCIFSKLKLLIDGSSRYHAILTIMLMTICMHMILGSNTTTVSVVVPGVIYMCQGILSAETVLFVVYITSVTQWLFPFHSVGLMMGVSKKYFSSKHILIMGIPLTFLVFLAVFILYIPWWNVLGL